MVLASTPRSFRPVTETTAEGVPSVPVAVNAADFDKRDGALFEHQ